MKKSVEIGPECSSASIDRKVIENVCATGVMPSGFKKLILNNGMVLELDKIKDEIGKTWKDMLLWISALSLSKPSSSEKSLRQVVKRLKHQAQLLSKNNLREELNELKHEEFRLPQLSAQTEHINENESVSSESLLSSFEHEIAQLINRLEDSNSHIGLLTEIIAEQNEQGAAKTEEPCRMKAELSKYKQEGKKNSKVLNDTMKKLGNLSARNVNKKLARREQKIKTLEKKNLEQAKTIAALEKENQKIGEVK